MGSWEDGKVVRDAEAGAEPLPIIFTCSADQASGVTERHRVVRRRRVSEERQSRQEGLSERGVSHEARSQAAGNAQEPGCQRLLIHGAQVIPRSSDCH